MNFGRALVAIAPVEGGVLRQDGCVQAPQRFAGIDAELTGEQVAGTPVGGQRLGLPPAAIQRQHQLAVQPLPQRILGGQLFQLAGEGVVPAKRQISIDPRLQRRRAAVPPGGLPQAG